MTMDKVTFIKSDLDQTEYAIIDRGNGEFTSMLKSTYDATLASKLADPAPTEKPAK